MLLCIIFILWGDFLTKNLTHFEKLNYAAQSIYDLGEHNVLIILNDGTNLTDWHDVDDRLDVLFVSENLSSESDLKERYADLNNLKAIVISDITGNAASMEAMFRNCFRLADVRTIDCDTSNVRKMNDLFLECNGLSDISFLADWDVSRVEDMSSMFDVCFSLGDISPLEGWNVSNLKDASYMFNDCHTLEDIGAFESWDVSGLWNMKGMFAACNYLKDLSSLSDWDVSNVCNMESLFDGCDYLDDVSPLKDWNVGNVRKMDCIFKDTNVKDARCLDGWNVQISDRSDIFRDCEISRKPKWVM